MGGNKAAVLSLIGLGLLALSESALVRAEESASPAALNPATAAYDERTDRLVDSAAVSIQYTAVQKMTRQLKRAAGTKIEPEILFRLAEIEAKISENVFRVAHGDAHLKGQELKMERYRQWAAKSAADFTSLMTRFPSSAHFASALFERAKIERNLGKTALALADLNLFIEKFPKHALVPLVHIHVGEMAMEEKKYAEAIEAFSRARMAGNATSAQLAYLFEKSGECHFLLNEYTKALVEIRNLADLLKADRKPSFQFTTALQAAARYYSTGIEKRVDNFTSAGALQYLQESFTEPVLGSAQLQMALNLRSRRLEKSLVEFKNQLLENGASADAGTRVLWVTYGALVEWGRYNELKGLSQDLDAISGGQTLEAMAKQDQLSDFAGLLLKTAEQLETTIGKTPRDEDYRTISPAFTALLDTYTMIANRTGYGRQILDKVTYRLADVHAHAHEFERAVAEFKQLENLKGDLGSKARLRLVEALYEKLRARKLIPATLAAKAIEPDKALDQELGDWIARVDRLSPKDAPAKDIEQFRFEAIRAMYAGGAPLAALSRVKDFVRRNPKSSVSEPLASLWVDTLVAMKDWDGTGTAIHDLLSIKEFGSKELRAHLEDLGVETTYKLVEAAYAKPDYTDALTRAQRFMADFPKSKHAIRALAVAANSALALKDEEQAANLFGDLLAKDPETEYVSLALGLRAQTQSRNFKLSEAIATELKLMDLPKGKQKLHRAQLEDMRVRVLEQSLALGERHRWRRIYEQLCDAPRGQCPRFEVLALHAFGPHMTADQMLENMHKARRALRPLWAALLIAKARQSGFFTPDVRYYVLRYLNAVPAEAELLDRILVGSAAIQELPGFYDGIRAKVAKDFPVSRDIETLERSLKKRLRSVETYEKLVEAGMATPWLDLRTHLLLTAAQAYIDPIEELARVKVPKELGDEEKKALAQVITKLQAPLREKAKKFLDQAVAMGGQNLVQPQLMHKIFVAYEKADPAGLAAIRPERGVFFHGALGPVALANVGTELGWTLGKVPGVSFWQNAIEKKNWAGIAYSWKELETQKALSSDALALGKSMSLAQFGAVAEAMAEESIAAKGLQGENHVILSLDILAHAFAAASKQGTRNWLMELDSPRKAQVEWLARTPETALLVVAASKWIEVAVPDEEALKERAMERPSLRTNEWLNDVRRVASESGAEGVSQ